jgi:hypothetical protein
MYHLFLKLILVENTGGWVYVEQLEHLNSDDGAHLEDNNKYAQTPRTRSKNRPLGNNSSKRLQHGRKIQLDASLCHEIFHRRSSNSSIAPALRLFGGTDLNFSPSDGRVKGSRKKQQRTSGQKKNRMQPH